jgi:hypothetical protein
MDFQWNFKILLAELKHVIGGLVVYLPDVPTTDAALQVAGDFDWVTRVGDTINACRNNPSCILTQVRAFRNVREIFGKEAFASILYESNAPFG